MIDAFIANDELAMIQYRLRTHSAFCRRFIIAESNVSIQREPKRRHVWESLSRAELRRYNVRLVFVPFRLSWSRTWNRTVATYVHVESRGGLSRESVSSSGLLEDLRQLRKEGKEVNNAMRHALNLALREELVEPTIFNASLVHMSDVDEILDPALGSTGLQQVLEKSGSACAFARMRYHSYSEHCGCAIEWQRSILFKAAALRTLLASHPLLYLRSTSKHLAKGQQRQTLGRCARPTAWLGWHLSYFMNSQQVLAKLNAWGPFLLYGSAIATSAVRSNNSRLVDSWASSCSCLYGGKLLRQPGRRWAFEDGRRPPTLGLPRHPAAPGAASFSLTELKFEAEQHAKAVKKATDVGKRHGQLLSDAQGRLAAVTAQIMLMRAAS